MGTEYILEIHGGEYPLPKKTIDIQEEMDRIDDENAKKLVNKRKKYENMFRFVIKMVGENAAKEIFETEDLSGINDIDLCTITISYLGIVRAYDKAVQDSQKNDVSQILNSAELGKIISLANSMEKIQNTVDRGTK